MADPTTLIARKLFLRFGWPALKIVASIVGVDELARIGWRWLLRITGTHPDRRNAIHRAEQVDGLIGTALLDDGAHWVVFKDDQPIVAYPQFNGDLLAALHDYRRDQLTSPDALPSRRAQTWFRTQVAKVAHRDRRDTAPSGLIGASREDDFRRIVDDLEPLLARLTGAPKLKLAEQPSVPEAPGVYLFSDGPNPVSVGQSSNLRQHLLADARPRAADMSVQVVEVDDPATRTIFEVYAARILGTDERHDP
jgi:hypothetical protein